MALTVTTAPEAEPISVAEAKAHMRVDAATENDLITALIVAARQSVELWMHRSLITQTLKLTLDGWPAVIHLPRGPVQSISSIKYYDSAGDQQTLSSDEYQSDLLNNIPRVTTEPTSSWPSTESGRMNSVEINYVAGYGDESADVPGPIKQAMLLLISEWFEQREAIIVGTTVSQLPFAVEMLLTQYDISGSLNY